MSLLYENTECPVCGKLFKSGDDIVTCPDCGTPHHRECYKAEGHCANESLHNEGFVFKRKIPEPEKTTSEKEANTEKTLNQNSYYEPERSSEYSFYVPVKSKNSEDESKPSEELDGIRLAEASDVVGLNTSYFIQNFIKRRKYSWNWSAFIFGPYYLFFRKMYRQGTMFMMLQLLCRLIISAVFAEKIYSFTKLYIKAFNYTNISKQIEYLQKLFVSQEFKDYIPAMILLFICMLIIHIVIGVFANSIYCKKVLSVIKYVDERMDSDQFMGFNPLFGSEKNMNSSEIRRLLLSKYGGVSIMAPMLAYAALYFITLIMSGI